MSNSLSPQEALEKLRNGNRQYLDGAKFENADLTPSRREDLAENGQAPYACILTCADSRVAPEILFQTGLGELFVSRVAGNIPTGEIVGSFEYAVMALNTPLIVVMGHSACGAVAGAKGLNPSSEKEFPPELLKLLKDVRSNFEAKNPDTVDEAVKINASVSAKQMIEKSPAISEKVKNGECTVVDAVYDLKTGQVTFGS